MVYDTQREVNKLKAEVDMLRRTLSAALTTMREITEVCQNIEGRVTWIEDYLNRHGDTDQPPPQV